MILDSITLTDFGLYAGRQSIELTPPSSDKPIILFGGQNGGGKTTLLDALQLCLFGAHAKTSGRGRLGYCEYLSRCIHDKAKGQQASIQIDFRRTVEGAEESYKLKRSWRRADGKCKEEFRVLKNERLAPALAENWATQVEDLLPANIAHLFLFDGEQIERYASPTESASLIGTAIQNLLGLDVVDRLDKDMRVFERRKKTEKLDDEAQEKVAAAETQLRELRSRLVGVRQDRASLRTHRLERDRRKLAEIEEEFRGLGGNLFERKQELEARLAEAEAVLGASSGSLRDLAAGPMPLLLVGELLASVASRDRDDQKVAQARQLHGLLGTRDEAMLEHLRTCGADAAACSMLRDYLDEDRSAYRSEADRETFLDLPPHVRGPLSALLDHQLEDLRRTAGERLECHAEAGEALEQARNVHGGIPQADAVADVMTRRDAAKTEIALLEAEDRMMSQEIERLEREIERHEKSLALLIEANVKDRGRRENRDRVLHNAGRVRETLATFRQAVIRRHVSRIEHLVLDSYQHLLRKSSLVTRLAIDTETFALTMFGKTGDVLEAEMLSAGERQLLGIALLWGLAKASGRPLPTAIDTPMGRLDTGHRWHFVDRYLPLASHQTLVFSTDEEIVGDYLQHLGPRIGRSYHLNYDDETGRTCVVPGYFDGEHVNGH